MFHPNKQFSKSQLFLIFIIMLSRLSIISCNRIPGFVRCFAEVKLVFITCTLFVENRVSIQRQEIKDPLPYTMVNEERSMMTFSMLWEIQMN